MSKKRNAETLPQPPWSYSPSEVTNWMTSTAGSRTRRDARSRRQVRVKEFIGHCPISAEAKLIRRLTALGFESTEGALSPLGGSASSPDAFSGELGDTRVRVRLRKRADLELQVTFAPRVSFRRASKLISRIGLRGLEGNWI